MPALKDLIATRRPGWSLPRPFYTDPEILNEEFEQVFNHQWLFAGHVRQIPKIGDFFTYELGHESLIIVRDASNAVHALFNVCRHRGSRICTTGKGHAAKLVCPYHQWVYDHNGELLAARHMPADFNKQEFGLKKANVRVLQGFIFIALSDDANDFDAIARQAEPYLAALDYPSAKIAITHTYDVKSNWKLIVENSRECYHCPVGHPEYSRIMAPPPQFEPAVREKTQAERIARYEKMGLPTQRIQGDGWHVGRYPLGQSCYVSESLDGKPVAPPMGKLTEPDGGVMGFIVFPNFMMEASADHAVTFRFTPKTPALTQIQATWHVRGGAVEGKDYQIDRVTGFWRATGEQDWKLCEDNQAGVNSTRYEPGPYGEEEWGTERFVQWYLEKMSRAATNGK